MELSQYQKLAMKTDSNATTSKEKLLNACLGLSGEVGEFNDHVKKSQFQGHVIDRRYLEKELGDILWYCALAAKAMGLDLNEVAQLNIEKLAKRYPQGFDSEKSINRV